MSRNRERDTHIDFGAAQRDGRWSVAERDRDRRVCRYLLDVRGLRRDNFLPHFQVHVTFCSRVSFSLTHSLGLLSLCDTNWEWMTSYLRKILRVELKTFAQTRESYGNNLFHVNRNGLPWYQPLSVIRNIYDSHFKIDFSISILFDWEKKAFKWFIPSLRSWYSIITIPVGTSHLLGSLAKSFFRLKYFSECVCVFNGLFFQFCKYNLFVEHE